VKQIRSLRRTVPAGTHRNGTQGYAGPEFLFSKDGTFPRYIDSYKRPMVVVQRALGLRPMSHHALSVATRSQAKRSPAGTPSRPCRRSLATVPSRARTRTRTSDRARSFVWSSRCDPSRHLTAPSRHRAKRKAP